MAFPAPSAVEVFGSDLCPPRACGAVFHPGLDPTEPVEVSEHRSCCEQQSVAPNPLPVGFPHQLDRVGGVDV